MEHDKAAPHRLKHCHMNLHSSTQEKTTSHSALSAIWRVSSTWNRGKERVQREREERRVREREENSHRIEG